MVILAARGPIHELPRVGSSESTGDFSEFFTVLDRKWKIYRSKGKKAQSVLSEPAVAMSTGGHISHIDQRQPLHYLGHRREEQLLERLVQGVSGRYLPFSMVVDENMELLHVVGDSSRYLRVPAGKMLRNVSKLAHADLSAPLATGVQRSLKEGGEVAYSNIRIHDVNSVDENGDVETTMVSIRFIPLPTRKGQDQLIAILIEESSSANDADAAGKTKASSYDVSAEEKQRILDLENELQFSRESLQATVEELETSNEELQATNEELLASNEELQSTNEELQSVNEELYTVNTEYQNKISELTEVNNDLDNLLGSTRIATLFLDNNLEIRRFTPEVTAFLNVVKQDIGRPFTHFTHDLIDIKLDQLISRVRDSESAVEQEVSDTHGSHYLMRILPYQLAPGVYSGTVLTFVKVERPKPEAEK